MRITPVGKQDDPFPGIPKDEVKKEVKVASLSKTAAPDPLVLVNSSGEMVEALNKLVAALSGEVSRIQETVATAKTHGLGEFGIAQGEIPNLIAPLKEIERMAGIFINNIESSSESKGGPAFPETETASEYLGE